MRKKPFILLAGLLCLALGVFAQSAAGTGDLETGVNLYTEGKFGETVKVLRRIGPSMRTYPEAIYWISLAELSLGDYNQALADLDTLEKADPRGRWISEIPYHRGRCLFYLGRYEDALISFSSYVDNSIDSPVSRRDGAYYWIGESLLAQGRLDDAADAFSVVVERYPSGAKYEAASYRLDFINQKKIEAELLAMLKWSHEESLKTMEEYQLREKTYEQAIASYQRRLAERPGGDMVKEGEYQSRLTAAEQQIAALESSLAEANAALSELRGGTEPALDSNEKVLRLLELKASALDLSNKLNKKLLGEE